MDLNKAVEHCWDRRDYLRRKHGDAFRQLIITKCVPEYFNDRLFNGIFGGMF